MQDQSQSETWNLYKSHFTPVRLAAYEDASGGNERKAQQLYDWNSEVSGAFWILIGHLEVALRNAIDKRMLEVTGNPNWILDFSEKLSGRDQYLRLEVLQASSRIEKQKKQLTPGKLVSELPFGFWASLFSKRFLGLWPELAGAFHGMPTRNQKEIQKLILDVKFLRNRIGHHHRIWSLNLEEFHNQILKLATFIDPDFGAHLARESRVEDLISKDPSKTVI